ncbi:MAG TPA: hypothetical protein PK156_44300 [Polyangium sp.]|nr:hypothetical protein [Polyangium sp.]
MSTNLKQVPRAEKRDIIVKVLALLEARAAAGPAEPALDAYIPEMQLVSVALTTHVDGQTTTQAQRAARLTRVEKADAQVDRLYRHVESYLNIESRVPFSDHALAVEQIYHTAFPDGLGHVDDPIADENRYCRTALGILQSPEHATTLGGIGFPMPWLTHWEAALDESDAAYAGLEKATLDKHAHIGAGQEAEDAWVEVFVRLRKYIGSRAKKTDTARMREGEALLAPLTTVLKQMAATAAARATKRKQETSSGTP